MTEMQSSAWQTAKIWVQSHVGLERDTFHVLIGLVLLGMALVASHGRLRLAPFVWALGIAAVLGCGMEVLDLRDDLATLGAPRWRVSALDLARTVLFPALGAIVVAMLLRRRGAE